MYILHSILDNMESTLYQGDRVVDPFYILDVQGIDSITTPNVAEFINLAIDTNKLIKETSSFDYEIWKHLTFTNQFINKAELTNEKIIRFIWYLCHKLIYHDTPFRPLKLYINDILKDDAKDKAYDMFFVHIYTRYDYYILDFNGCIGTMIKIKFKDNSRL